MRPRTKILGVLVLLAVVTASAILLRTLRYGFSARDEPSRIEHVLARAVRHYAAPSDLRGRKNPVQLTPDLLSKARAHFADHCAYCHGNDGRGQTSIGRSFYPKAPEMTLPETQSQSDGELFATIENGIRLTAMPAWGDGTAESARGSWELVHFVRHLPKITPEELAEMESLNPKSRKEFEEEEQTRRFLAGEDVKPSGGAESHHH
jgi:mono/diheme cytochrome c family protein